MIILIIGGSGSGKSAYAENRILEMGESGSKNRYYIATMKVYGDEGHERVKKHRDNRAGKNFITIEQERDVKACCGVIRKNHAAGDSAGSDVLLECVSNLVANEMFDGEYDNSTEFDNDFVQKLSDKIVEDIKELSDSCDNLVIVTNDIFRDAPLYDESTECYINVLAQVNGKLADLADEVTEVVVGIPVRMK